jgi:hypothetical protein
MMWSVRFSDGGYGPLVSREDAVRALDGVDPIRRSLCKLTCWEEVVAETIRPAELTQRASPYGEDLTYRSELPTLVEEK